MKKTAATHRCNALVEAADWPALAILRDELGAQGEEWAAEVLSRIDVAVALAGPAAAAAALLETTVMGRFGPLWETVALREDWEDVVAVAPPTEATELALHTRALIGASTAAAPFAGVLGVPIGLADWEVVLEPPHYSLGGFSSGCIPSGFEEVAPLALPTASGSPEAVPVLEALVPEWSAVVSSAGDGTALEVAATLGVDFVGGEELPIQAVYPHLVAAAAGASAYGRWQGLAAGRVAVWRSLAALAGLSITPCDAAALSGFLANCRWWGLSCGEQDEIWFLHFAIENATPGRAWALSANDCD